jgi:hypothetical protein
VVEGQVRHLPPSGEFGGFWEQASCPRGEYQNGGYWATPTGWLIAALRKVDMPLADRTLSDLVNHLREHREAGAPWEWISPQKSKRVNPRYAASVGLVCVALEESAK